MYKKVLLAVDDSLEARSAAEHVLKMAASGLAEKVILVHAIPEEAGEIKPRWPGEYGIDVPVLKEASDQTVNAIALKLDYARNLFQNAGIAADLKVFVGNPAEVICALIAQEAVDLVALGSRGLSRLEGIIMDSISQHVVLCSPVPVLLFNPQAAGVAKTPKEVYEF